MCAVYHYAVCRKLLVTFQTIYSVSIRNASVNLPEAFQQKVRGWLGNDEKLFQEIYDQVSHNCVSHVTITLTCVHSLHFIFL